MKKTPKNKNTAPIVAVKPNLCAFFKIKVKAFHADWQKLLLVSAI
jgi:hypothetical protein